MTDCIFCKIAAKQIPSRALYEDDELIAFHDIHPHAPVHFLIVPKAHIETLTHVDDSHSALLGRMMVLAAKLAKEQGCAYQVGADGRESGHIQKVHDIRLDCDEDVVLLKVEQVDGIACHTGRHSCFFQQFAGTAKDGQWVAAEPVLKSPDEIYK